MMKMAADAVVEITCTMLNCFCCILLNLFALFSEGSKGLIPFGSLCFSWTSSSIGYHKFVLTLCSVFVCMNCDTQYSMFKILPKTIYCTNIVYILVK